MKKIALEELVASTILNFCENAAELGCPKDKEVDMWFRYLSPEEQVKVGGKLLDIIERDSKRFGAVSNKKTKKNTLRFGTMVECDRIGASSHKCDERRCPHRNPHKFSSSCLEKRSESGEAWCTTPGFISPLDGDVDGGVVKCVPVPKTRGKK